MIDQFLDNLGFDDGINMDNYEDLTPNENMSMPPESLSNSSSIDEIDSVFSGESLFGASSNPSVGLSLSEELPYSDNLNINGFQDDSMMMDNKFVDDTSFSLENNSTFINDPTSNIESLPVSNHEPFDHDSTMINIPSSDMVSFTGASAFQDSQFAGFKDYLNFHCHISSYEIHHTNGLITPSGDYDYDHVSNLETWVRTLYAKGKISSYDEQMLMNYLRSLR